MPSDKMGTGSLLVTFRSSFIIYHSDQHMSGSLDGSCKFVISLWNTMLVGFRGTFFSWTHCLVVTCVPEFEQRRLMWQTAFGSSLGWVPSLQATGSWLDISLLTFEKAPGASRRSPHRNNRFDILPCVLKLFCCIWCTLKWNAFCYCLNV